MSKSFKPMLSGKADLSKLVYPVLVSPKLDGIRCIIIDGVAMSRSLKPIRNEHVQKLFGNPEYNGYDGELIVGSPNAEDVYRQSSSGVMSKAGEPDVKFYVFDDITREEGFGQHAGISIGPSNFFTAYHSGTDVQYLSNRIVEDEEELLSLERNWVEEGYEGVMIRSFDGPYKQGRSTTKEGYLLKLKTFEDSEAVVMECLELMHNDNEATTDALGHTVRSSHKENKTPAGTLGKLRVIDRHSGVEFKIGTGFTAAQRAEMWAMREELKGKLVKYKFFPVGVKEKPRHPVYLGIRDEDDLDE